MFLGIKTNREMKEIAEIQKFIEWYWRVIDGKPSSDSSLTIAEWYLEDMTQALNDQKEY